MYKKAVYTRGILMVSDLHLGDFLTRNPYKDFRLNQSFKIAENICKAGKTYNCKKLFILGDLLELDNKNSVIHNRVKKFFRILKNNFEDIYYILGNHDMTQRSETVESRENDFENSYIGLYAPKSFIYADRQVLEIYGKKFAFKNFSRGKKLKLDFITEQGYETVDYLCGHSSQDYDENIEIGDYIQAYNEALIKSTSFFGHIHQSGWKGKNVSIGVGQRCKIKDDKPQFVVLYPEEDTWMHIDADPDHILMDLQITDRDEDYYDNSQNIYFISKKKVTDNKELAKTLEETNYEKIFEQEIKNNNLSDCLVEVKRNTPSDKLEVLDLNFYIKLAHIQNYRSLGDYTYEPGKERESTLLTGENGSGKSTLLEGLKYGLTGEFDGLETDSIMNGQDFMSVEIYLLYRSHEYYIKRLINREKSTRNIIELWQDGEKLELGGLRDTKLNIKKYLPFIEAHQLFYYNKEHSNILGNGGKENTEILHNLYKSLGLNSIDAYYETSLDMLKDSKKKVADLEKNIGIKAGILESKKDQILSYQISLGIDNNTNIPEAIKQAEEKLDYYQKIYNEYKENEAKKKQYKSLEIDIKSAELSLQNNEDRYGSFLSDSEYVDIINSHTGIKTEYQNQVDIINKKRSEYKALQVDLEYIKREGNSLVDQENKLKSEMSKPIVCPLSGLGCGNISTQDRQKKYQENIEKIHREIEEKTKKYYDIQEKLKEYTVLDTSDLDNKIQEETRVIYGAQDKLKQKQILFQEIEKTKLRITDLKEQYTKFSGIKEIDLPENILETLSILTSRKSGLNQYVSLVQEYNESSEKYERDKIIFQEENKRYNDLVRFIDLTNPAGIIYEKILEIIVKTFSDSRVRYSIKRGKGSSRNYISINAYIRTKDGNEVSYQNASTGERTLIDIHFLEKLNIKFGLLIFDEFLANLDPDNYNNSIGVLKGLNANAMFLSSHLENIVSDFDRVIKCRKENGVTIYQDN